MIHIDREVFILYVNHSTPPPIRVIGVADTNKSSEIKSAQLQHFNLKPHGQFVLVVVN